MKIIRDVLWYQGVRMRVKIKGEVYDDFFFQAEDGIRDLVRSRGLGDVYKRQRDGVPPPRKIEVTLRGPMRAAVVSISRVNARAKRCLLYTSDAADDLLCVDPGGRLIIKKKKIVSV